MTGINIVPHRLMDIKGQGKITNRVKISITFLKISSAHTFWQGNYRTRNIAESLDSLIVIINKNNIKKALSERKRFPSGF